ncbi:TonB family protein [Undibacterium sp. Xuan67W]|uniref:energy transducer TonB n=1 Tax=Undibacterium sp. Xuan67W TaxID=3413057 RepID=UPI003BF02B05
MRHSVGIRVCVACVIALLAACQKKPANEQASAATSASAQAPSAPTGIVKNAIRHTEETADVTKWMEMASTKTPAQLAEEAKQKQIKETNAEKDSKPKTDIKSPDPKLGPAQEQPKQTAIVAAQQVLPNNKSNDVQVVATAVVPIKPPQPAPVQPTNAPAPVQSVPELSVPKLISSVQPAFPAAAILAGITEGSVSARLTIGLDGKVAQVEIIKAKPAKVFDKEVVSAASQWRYAPLSAAQTRVVDFNFQNALKLISSVQPSFPQAAIQAGVTEGLISARISIGVDGKVSQVDIIKSKPLKYFDKEVIAAASQWRYAPISSAQTTIIEFAIKQSN